MATKENLEKLNAIISRYSLLVVDARQKSPPNKRDSLENLQESMFAARVEITVSMLENLRDHTNIPLEELEYELMVSDLNEYKDPALQQLLQQFTHIRSNQPITPLQQRFEGEDLRRDVLIYQHKSKSNKP